MDDYTWIVSHGALVGDSSGSVGQIGPPGKTHARFDIVIKSGEQFRLFDQSGDMRYSGWIYGSYTGMEPLEEYGRAKGCASIAYLRGGEWVTIGPNS